MTRKNRKPVAVLLSFLLAFQTPIYAAAAPSGLPIQESTPLGSTLIITRPTPTPTPGRGLIILLPTPTPIIINGGWTVASPTPAPDLTIRGNPPVQTDPAAGSGTDPNDGAPGTAVGTVEPEILPADPESLTELTLHAAKYPPDHPSFTQDYPMESMVFVDWNTAAKKWNFRWDVPTGSNDDVLGLSNSFHYLWQVSSMPFDSSFPLAEYPPGYITNGPLNADNHTFTIDFAKFAPSREKITQKPVSEPTKTVVNQSFLSRLTTLTNPTGGMKLSLYASSIKKNTARVTAQLALSAKTPKTNAAAQNLATLTAAGKTPDYQQVMEAIGLKQTLYKYYIRVVGYNAMGKTAAVSSNQMLVTYGDPFYDGTLTPEPLGMFTKPGENADTGASDFITMSWDAAKTAQKAYVEAPLAQPDGYGYSWFQFTTAKPSVDAKGLFQPDGLVNTYAANRLLSGTYSGTRVSTTLNFAGLLPVKTALGTKGITLYLRGIHVYPDYDRPGHANLTLSDPMNLHYGPNTSDAANEAMKLDVDIGTPAVRITAYSPPYDGSQPKDHALVVRSPLLGGFTDLKAGQQVRISQLKDIAEDRARSAPWYEQFLDGMAFFFTSMVNAINSVSGAWASIQAYAVQAMAQLGIPPVVGGLLLNAALTALGVPPTLPNLDSITSGSLSAMIVDQSGGWIPKDVADKMSNSVLKQAKETLDRPISGLPEEIGSLNGCLKSDPAFIWRPATITLELKNTSITRMPSGEFNLGATGFQTERIPYPSLDPGKSLTLTVPLTETTKFTIKDGEKKISRSAWSIGTPISATVSNFQPVLPTQQNLSTEYGLPATMLLVRYHELQNLTQVNQLFGAYDKEWKSVNPRFPTILYVATPAGNRTGKTDGTRTNPFTSLQAAINAAQSGDAIVLLPGIHESDPLTLTKAYFTLAGYGPGTALRGRKNTSLSIVALNTPCTVLSGFTLFGSINISGTDMKYAAVKNMVITQSDGPGLTIGDFVRVSDCVVSNTGKKFPKEGDGIRLLSNDATLRNFNVNSVPGNGLFLKFAKLGYYSTAPDVSNGMILGCGQNGILLDHADTALIENVAVRNTDLAGVGFIGSDHPQLRHCTILDTAKKGYGPVTFYASDKASVTNQLEIYGQEAEQKYPFLVNCIIAQVAVTTGNLLQVNYTQGKESLASKLPPLLDQNVYFMKTGTVGFYDGRPTELRGCTTYDASLEGKSTAWLPYTSLTWQNWTDDTESIIQNPALDAYGRTTVVALKGYGVQ